MKIDISRFGSDLKSKVAERFKSAKDSSTGITEADTAGITADDVIAEAANEAAIEELTVEELLSQADDEVIIASDAAPKAELSETADAAAETEVKAEAEPEAVAEAKEEAKNEPKAKRSFTVDANTVRSAWLVEAAAAVLTSAVAIIVASVF